ncbi:hypothetical protein [Tuwongella immobilis]|uniref:Uncharacterized protein n=1 Tax=Tuwongella immobilis TaxID=692036 RepID=A0A6C2YN35_9BACT|nr:hypothetical protein [Tuwongella immobilis]VIP02794.1 unnamed protein product [Tuwongella immobilis]VTS02470.1 unnamed protein product [Tuwongella immobilis]
MADTTEVQTETSSQPPLFIMALSAGAILAFLGLVAWLLSAVPQAEKDRVLSEDRKVRELKLRELRAADSEKLGQANIPGVISEFVNAGNATKALPLPAKPKAAAPAPAPAPKVEPAPAPKAAPAPAPKAEPKAELKAPAPMPKGEPAPAPKVEPKAEPKTK